MRSDRSALSARFRGSKNAHESGGTYPSLDHQERSALQLIAEGYTDREIAFFLRLTVAGAGEVRARLMRRLDLHSQAEVISWARGHGLIPKSSRPHARTLDECSTRAAAALEPYPNIQPQDVRKKEESQ